MSDGTSENGTSSGSVTGGTASDALIAAASAASSADTSAEGTSATPTPSATAAPGGPTVPATSGPEASGQPAPAAGTRGPIPLDRHEQILRNTRAELEGRYGWAKDLNPQQAQTAVQLLNELQRDPAAFYRELGQRLNGGRQETTPQVEEQDPEPLLVSQDGKEKAYTAGQLKQIRELDAKRLRASILAEFAPMMDFFKSEQGTRQENAVRAEADQVAQAALADARKLPHFTKENEPEIAALFAAIPPETKQRYGSVAALMLAYNQFLAQKVFPTIETDAARKVRDANDRKAATSAGHAHPTSQGGSGKPVALKNVTDLARHMERLAEAG